MKKFCAILFSFVLIVVLALPAAAEGESAALSDTAPSLTASAAYVVNLDTNIVVYDKNSEAPLSAASLTKMMTTLLLLESYQDQLDSISLTAPSYIYDLIWEQSTNASTADIRRGGRTACAICCTPCCCPAAAGCLHRGRLYGRRQH